MKKFIAILAIMGICFAGCAWLKTEEAKVVSTVESVNWSEVLTYWQNFEKGLLEALPVVGAVFKNDSQTIAKVTTAVTDANSSVTALATTLTAYQAGTLTQAEAVSAAKTVETNVVAASNLIGSLISPGAPAATPPATPQGAKPAGGPTAPAAKPAANPALPSQAGG